MQDGSVTVERRKRGPDVWCFRWREAGPDGRRKHRRIALGTADELRSIASARKMVVGLRREININDVRIRRESIKLADLSRHFQQRELADRNPRISYSTKKAYAGYLEKWIDPRWGEYRLLDVRTVEVESWLKSLNRAPGTRSKIRNVKLAARVAGGLLFIVAALVVVSSGFSLLGYRQPQPSFTGIILLIVAAIGMPWLASQKRKLATQVASASLRADATESALCGYLSLIALAGLLANLIFHAPWADPIVALALVPLIAREGWEAIHASRHCCC